MKGIIFCLLLTLNLFAQKSPKDVVDFNNFDYAFAENLLHKKFNEELVRISEKYHPMNLDSIAFKAIEYQLNHIKNGGEFSHKNTKKFRNVLLEASINRIEYFINKKYKGLSVEVLTTFEESYYIRDTTKKQYYVEENHQTYGIRMVKSERLNDGRKYFTFNQNTNTYKYIDDSNFLYNDEITYERIINIIYENFMIKSEYHRWGITMASENKLDCFWKIEFENINNKYRIWCGAIFLDKKEI